MAANDKVGRRCFPRLIAPTRCTRLEHVEHPTDRFSNVQSNRDVAIVVIVVVPTVCRRCGGGGVPAVAAAGQLQVQRRPPQLASTLRTP